MHVFSKYLCKCRSVKPLDSLSLSVLLIGSVALDLTSFILVGQRITLGVMVGDHMLSGGV